MKFLYEEQLDAIKKNLMAHNEKVSFGPAEDHDIFYLKHCGIPETIVNYYEFAEPDDVVEILDSRMWPISILRLENEKMEPGSLVFPKGYFVIGTTVFGDCFCLNLNKIGKTKEIPVVLVSHDRINLHASINDILQNIKPISRSFQDFLSSFAKGKLKITS